jgi:hypothetical protein
MRSSHAAAAWIFNRLDIDSALAGDLLEECSHGRSLVWYWRQVAIAIWSSIWRTIVHHKLLALRALVIGYAVNEMWLFLWRFLRLPYATRPGMSRDALISIVLILLTQVVTGWVVARTHRAHAVPMVFIFAGSLVMAFLAASHSEVWRLFVNSIDQPRFRPYFWWYLLPIFIEVMGLLIGGVAAVIPTPARSGE